MSVVRTAFGHWVVEGDLGVSETVARHGTFAYPDALYAIGQCAFAIPAGAVVVDAGACIGDHTALYAQMVGREGRVHAFEPHPGSREALLKNVGHLMNVSVHEEALSHVSGMSKFSMTPTNIGASFLGISNQFDTTFVETITLDEALRHTPRLDFIHLDAEGMEPQILDGAKALIERFHPVLMVEVTDQWLQRYGSSAQAFLGKLAGLGYGTMLKVQVNAAQFDVIAIPAQPTVRFPAPQEAILAEVP